MSTNIEVTYLAQARQIMVVFALCHDIIILLYHIYRLIPKFKESLNRIQILSVIAIFMITLFCVCGVIDYNDLYQSTNVYISLGINCKWKTIIYMIVYALSKFSVYFLCLERLFSIFNESYLQCNKCQIIFGRILFISLLITLLLLSIFVGFDPNKVDKTEPLQNCEKGRPATWIQIYTAIQDALICFILSNIFSRKLLSLQRSISLKHDGYSYQDILSDNYIKLVQRTVLLACIVLISTPASLITAALFGISAFWFSIDGMINIWCIILMFKVHKRVYRCICGNISDKLSIKCLEYYTCERCTRYIEYHDLQNIDDDKSEIEISKSRTLQNK